MWKQPQERLLTYEWNIERGKTMKKCLSTVLTVVALAMGLILTGCQIADHGVVKKGDWTVVSHDRVYVWGVGPVTEFSEKACNQTFATVILPYLDKDHNGQLNGGLDLHVNGRCVESDGSQRFAWDARD